MIFILLAFLCLADAAVRPRHGTDDEIEGVFYEIPEYEDPGLTMFKLLSRGAMPVFTLMQEPKVSEDYLNEKDDTPSSKIDDIKKEVDDLKVELQLAKSGLGKGESQIFEDIEKLTHYLMSLKNHFHRTSHPTYASGYQSTTSDESPKALIDSDISEDHYFASDRTKPLTSDASTILSTLSSGDASKKNLTSDTSKDGNVVYSKLISSSYLSSSNASVELPLAFDNSSKKSVPSNATILLPLLFDFSVVQSLSFKDSSKKPAFSDTLRNQSLTSDEAAEQPSISTESSKNPVLSNASNDQSSSAANTSASLESSVSDKKVLSPKDSASNISKYHYFVPDMPEPFHFASIDEYIASRDSSKKPVAAEVSKNQDITSDTTMPPYLVIDTFVEQSSPSEGSAEISATSDSSKNQFSSPGVFVTPYLKSEASTDRLLASGDSTKLDDSTKFFLATGDFPDTYEESSEIHFTSDDFEDKYSVSDASIEHSLTSGGKQKLSKSEGEIFYTQPLFSKHNPEVEDIRPEGKKKASFRDEVHITEVNKSENKEKAAVGKWIWKSSSSA